MDKNMDVFRRELVTNVGFFEISEIYHHEFVISERLDKFVTYLKSLAPQIIIPSIIVCNKTNALIDGHHRCHALLELGFKRCPVSFVNYDSEHIIPHLDQSITKNQIIEAALGNNLLPPKSSMHHLIDFKGRCRPIVLLSYLSDME